LWVRCSWETEDYGGALKLQVLPENSLRNEAVGQSRRGGRGGGDIVIRDVEAVKAEGREHMAEGA